MSLRSQLSMGRHGHAPPGAALAVFVALGLMSHASAQAQTQTAVLAVPQTLQQPPDPPFYPHETVSEDGAKRLLVLYNRDKTCEMLAGPVTDQVYTFWSTCNWNWAGSEFQFTIHAGSDAGKLQPKRNGNLIGRTPANGPFKSVSATVLASARAQAAASGGGRPKTCAQWDRGCRKYCGAAPFRSDTLDLYQRHSSGLNECERGCERELASCQQIGTYSYSKGTFPALKE